jgi:predicted ATP-grasp superfamily ATP-dependent carboligase
VADFFADADTARLASRCMKLEGEFAAGMSWPALEVALEALTDNAPGPLGGLVYGAGFEDRPELLDKLATRRPLLGNDAATVARIKDPFRFFAALDRLQIPHPRTRLTAPSRRQGWLAKLPGGAGGAHVLPALAADSSASVYFQERVRGRSISALFVANGNGARLLGFSEQWTASTRSRPFRYGGSARLLELSPMVAHDITAAVARVAREFALRGLGSADFMVRGREALLLEVNPRPGATLDIFDCDAAPLFRLHLDAVREGHLPEVPLVSKGSAASAIVFAPRDLVVPDLEWPAWVADRPKAGERIEKARPICTVLARATAPAGARRLVEEKISIILNLVCNSPLHH